MTVHQCPKCELRFAWQTELDDHCRNDHPGFSHVYPAALHKLRDEPPPEQPAAEHYRVHLDRPNPVGWLSPRRGPAHHGG